MENRNVNVLRRFLRLPAWWLSLGVLAFIAYFGITVWYRQHNFFTAQFDLGNMVQVLWQSLHGRWFMMVDPRSGLMISRASIHTDFLLLIYLPFYAIWHSPLTLLYSQVIAVASGALPLFLLARKKISPSFGLLLSWLYLLYPPLLWALRFDVHAVVLVTPLILWAWWAMDVRRWWLAGVFFGLAMLGKEEIGLLLAINAVYWLRDKERRRFAFGMLVIGLGWSALMVGWVIPHFRHAPGHFALSYYAAYGDSVGQILRTIITKPWIIFHDLLRVTALRYYLNLLLPVGGLAVLGWPILLIALPELAINVLSNNGNLQTIYYQYTSAITPYVFLAAVYGSARWYERLRQRKSEFNFHFIINGAHFIVVLCALFSVYRWAPLPLTIHDPEVQAVFLESPDRVGIDALQKIIPPNQSLAVTNNVAPQFINRDNIWGFPNRLEAADGIVILTGGKFEQVPVDEINRRLDLLLHDPTWHLVYHQANLFYFHRAG